MNKLKNEYGDTGLAQIWIDFLTLYTDFFAPLPGFESRYFKEERIDLIIKILTKKFDGKNQTRSPLEALKATVANKTKEESKDSTFKGSLVKMML